MGIIVSLGTLGFSQGASGVEERNITFVILRYAVTRSRTIGMNVLDLEESLEAHNVLYRAVQLMCHIRPCMGDSLPTHHAPL